MQLVNIVRQFFSEHFFSFLIISQVGCIHSIISQVGCGCYGNILYSIYDTTFGVQLQCFTTLDKFYRNTHNPPVIFMNVYNPPVIFLEKKKNVLSRTVEQCSLTAWFECIQPICDIIRNKKKTFRAELSDNVH